MMTTGSSFVRDYARKGYIAWEAAAIALARAGELTPFPWIEIALSDGDHEARLRVASDVLAVGPFEDRVRLPLRPVPAQTILNLAGSLLPTPWLNYQIWRHATAKLMPIPMVPNKGADLLQYAEHSYRIDEALANLGVPPAGQLVAGIKKAIVVANNYRKNVVLIQGWYRADGPDVFDDKRNWEDPNRQPRQVLSNAHGDFYVDYSHGVRAVHGRCLVDGQEMLTADLYAHPTLSRLVSNEGPLRMLRYPGAGDVHDPPPWSAGGVTASNDGAARPDDPPPAGGDAPYSPSPYQIGLAEIADDEHDA